MMSSSADVLARLLPALKTDLQCNLDGGNVTRKCQTKDIVDELCRNVRQHCEAAIAGLKSFHNETHARARFPPEVWCIIWSFLDDDHLVRVTHVCRAWRAIATDYAPFWTQVRFWSTVHQEGSDCDDGLCECPEELEAMHNLAKVATWLRRSKALPITFDMAIYPVFSDHSLAAELAEIVRPHGPRIRSTVYQFGDVAFFVKFAQLVVQFDTLEFLRMSRITYLQEQNTWPVSKLQLDSLHVPQLRELRGYGDFWWGVSTQRAASTFAVIERLRCNFRAPRSFYDCLHLCPSLVFLNAELDGLPLVIDTPALSIQAEDLSPCLEELVLDRMTRRWELPLSDIVRRPTLRRLTLRYNDYAVETLFLPLSSLSGAVGISLRVEYPSIILDAIDEDKKSRSLQFHQDVVRPNDMHALGRMWNYLPAGTLRTLKIAWALRGALLNTTLVASRLSRVTFVVQDPAGKTADRPTEELLARNDPALAGRPSLPRLNALKLEHADHPRMRSHTKLSSASVHGLAAALSDITLSLELAGVDLT